jgi:hypothetical protein
MIVGLIREDLLVVLSTGCLRGGLAHGVHSQLLALSAAATVAPPDMRRAADSPSRRMDKTHPDEKDPVYPRTGQGQFGRSIKRLGAI